MTDFKQFPKGNIKRNSNFYLWAILAGMFLVMGLITLLTGKFEMDDLRPVHGRDAYIVGIAMICFGSYFLYHLFHKAEEIEESHVDFHQLDDFDEIINEYRTTFEIDHVYMPTHKSAIPCFFYKLEIEFNNSLQIGLNIRLRDKLEFILWKIGLTRIFDVLTDNYYFDSRYRVKCTNPELFRKIVNPNVIRLLERFDRDYPPIRKRNGILVLTDTSIKYIEGSYNEDQKVFDPHRGRIENMFKELIAIIKEIEKSKPQRK